MEAIGPHIRYPPKALHNHTQGTVLLYYEVSETGTIENTEIIRSVSAEVDAEVKRVALKSIPVAQPAQQGGKPVRVFTVIPVVFAVR